MSIQLGPLRDRLARKLGLGGTTFDSLFIEAVNDVSRDLDRECFQDIDQVDEVNAVIDLGNEFYPAYREGVSYYMQASGEISREPDPTAYQKYRRALAECQFVAIEALDPSTGTMTSNWGE